MQPLKRQNKIKYTIIRAAGKDIKSISRFVAPTTKYTQPHYIHLTKHSKLPVLHSFGFIY